MNFDFWEAWTILIVGITSSLAIDNEWQDGTGSSSTSRNGNLSTVAYRRQNIIHALSDDSIREDEDIGDIDSLGRSVDASGNIINVLKSKSSAGKKEQASTKDIIERMKAIQEKLFKRTGNQELEAKLNLMSPDQPSLSSSRWASRFSLNVAGTNITKLNKTSGSSGAERSLKLNDGSQMADRRKIIPEEVVDKILAKFQQLREEAKHMALLEAHREDKEGTDSSTRGSAENESGPSQNPYASIEQPKENTELKNLTLNNIDITSVGIDESATEAARMNSNNENQITSTDASSLEANQPDLFKGQVPMMFIKTGQLLVPVYGNPSSELSVTGSAQAQLKNSASVAAPSLPRGVNAQFSIQDDTSNRYLPEVAGVSRCVIAGISCAPRLADIPGRGSQLILNPLQTSDVNVPLGSGSALPFLQKRVHPDQPFFKNERMALSQDSQYDPNSMYFPTVDNAPSTAALINQIMHAPGFPILAARLMSESTPLGTSNMDEMGDVRQLNSNMQGTSPGFIQFGLQQNLASNEQGQPNMLSNLQYQNLQEQMPMPDLSGIQGRNSPLSQNPFQDAHPELPDNIAQLRRQAQLLDPKNFATNDISDPVPFFDAREREAGQYSSGNLPDYTKQNSIFQSRNVNEILSNDASQNEMITQSPWKASPGRLLDLVHHSQLNGELLGAGDPNWFSKPSYPQAANELEAQGKNPDDLLEMLNKENLDAVKNHHSQRSIASESLYSRSQLNGWDTPDPSFADFISDHRGFGQPIEVQSKSLATESNGDLPFYSKPERTHLTRAGVSVLPDNLLQFRHGRMSMDSANVINNFYKDEQYRNRIEKPQTLKNNGSANMTEQGHEVVTFTRSLGEDNIELKVNGRDVPDAANWKRMLSKGKKEKGRTIMSKGPVQIELFHTPQKRKVVNIVTQSAYNVTFDDRRAHIPKHKLPT